jgi:hypothetical protein
VVVIIGASGAETIGVGVQLAGLLKCARKTKGVKEMQEFVCYVERIMARF